MCGMNLIRQSLESFLQRLGLKLEKVDNSTVFPGIKRALKLFKRILPQFQADAKLQRETIWLYKQFYNAITNGFNKLNLNDPRFRNLNNLKTKLSQINCPIWRCAATGAAVRKLANVYMHHNGSLAVRTFLAYSNINIKKLPSFFQIIRDHNSWKLTNLDMEIINVMMTSIGDQAMGFHDIVDKDGMRIVLPIQNPLNISKVCLP